VFVISSIHFFQFSSIFLQICFFTPFSMITQDSESRSSLVHNNGCLKIWG
jgi:hypothetical protein